MRKTAEAVIIGGGCMGTSTAYHLAKQGLKDIVVIEREPMLGMGSTGRNAGGVRHQFSTEANVRLSIESISLFERFNEEVGYQIDFHQDGYLFLLSTEASVSTFRKNVEMQRRLGVDVQLLSAAEAAKLAPGLAVDGVREATFCQRDGIADPNGVTQGFAKAAQALGVEISRETEATGIELAGERVCAVGTTRGRIAAPVAVNAAGPHARQIGQMVGLDVPVLPYRRHIFITEPATHLSVPNTRIMVIDFETTFYFHREGPGILFGMSDPDEPSSFNLAVNWELLERLTPIAVKRLPALAQLGIAHCWAGLYETTPDAMPIIGGSEIGGFYMVTGFSGHGFQHCPAAGRILADIICGRDPGDVAAFAFQRFKSGGIEPEATVV